MSKARAKGTAGENETVDYLVGAGFPRADPEDPSSEGVERLQGGFESHDIHFKNMDVHWVVESKYRKRWSLMAWIRKIRKRAIVPAHEIDPGGQFARFGIEPVQVPAGERPWVIFCIHGDRRTVEGREVGSVAVMDAQMAADLIYHWEAPD